MLKIELQLCTVYPSKKGSVALIILVLIVQLNSRHLDLLSLEMRFPMAAYISTSSFTPIAYPNLQLRSRCTNRLRTSCARKRRVVASASTPPPDPRGINGTLPFYLALVGAQSIPFFIPHSGIVGDLSYFTVTALACIVIGCRRAPLEQILSEPISKTQAFAAPFAASTFLFGSYLLLKYTNVNIGLLFNGITTLAGTFCLKEALDPVFHSVLTLGNLQDKELYREEKPKEKVESESEEDEAGVITVGNLLSTATAIGTTALYLTHQDPNYVYSNVIAVAICTRVLSLVRPASFLVATGLLSGLFLYDIFWVFGSEVMVSVATQIDSPGKLLFPRDGVTQGAYPYAILGLGDVCVPGLFASLAQSMDERLAEKGEAPYFSAAVVGYTVGLLTCFGVNLKTQAAQPALLYLVPALILSILGMGAVRGQLNEVVKFKLDQGGKEVV